MSVDLEDARKARGRQLLFEVLGGGAELGEDDDLSSGDFRLVLEEPLERIQLVVLSRIEVEHVLDEHAERLKVHDGVEDHVGEIEVVLGEVLLGLPDILRQVVLELLKGAVLRMGADEVLDVFDDVGLLGEEPVNRVLALGAIVGRELLEPRVDADARVLKRRDGTLEALQEELAHEVHHLLLAADLHRVDLTDVALEVRLLVRRVDRQGENRRRTSRSAVAAAARLDEVVRQLAVGIAQRVVGDVRQLLDGKDDATTLGRETPLHECAAALDDERRDERIAHEHAFGNVHPLGVRRFAGCLLELRLHLLEVSDETVDAQRGIGEVGVVLEREQLDHVLEVSEAVVDGRRRQHEELLARCRLHDLHQLAVAVGRLIAEVVRLVDDDDLRLFGDLLHQVLVPLQQQVGVVDDLERREALEDVRHVLADRRLPD